MKLHFNNNTQYYRADIDCLRGLAVLMVILFHCEASLFQGGFIGVDIFFVISGYVIFKSTENYKRFGAVEIIDFYKKRLFRIYPALLLMLILTFIVCIFSMSTVSLDYFGKQLFFSSLSASNILYAQGHNYFDSNSPMLLHTWSLGIEMQFYLLFPFIIFVYRYLSRPSHWGNNYYLYLLLLLSFIWAASHSTEDNSFFLLQNRAFEFLIGMCAALLSFNRSVKKITKHAVTIAIAAGLILCSIFFTNGEYHPGLSTIIPCVLAAVSMIFFSSSPFYEGKITSVSAYIGRISYGIYLFHFPITIFAKEILSDNTLTLILVNLLITLPLSHFSYRYFEGPIRRYGYKNTKKVISLATIIILVAIMLSSLGYLAAKKEGWPIRLKYFNGYAYNLTQVHTQSKTKFQRGYNVDKAGNQRILFIGDSVLQQYIDPISQALNIPAEKVDSVTRGGCLLLKNVDFHDTFADISCNSMRRKLYNITKQYDYVIISQDWSSYRKTLLNADISSNKDHYDYIMPFISDTLIHFKNNAKNIILLGIHPTVKYKTKLEIGPSFTQNQYQSFKNSLEIAIDSKTKRHNNKILDKLASQHGVKIINPISIFCNENLSQCILQNHEWSYFYDSQHITKVGQSLAEIYFSDILKAEAQ